MEQLLQLFTFFGLPVGVLIMFYFIERDSKTPR